MAKSSRRSDPGKTFAPAPLSTVAASLAEEAFRDLIQLPVPKKHTRTAQVTVIIETTDTEKEK